MTAQIIELHTGKKHSADDNLNNAVGHLEEVLIIGKGVDGNMYFSTNVENVTELLFFVEIYKKELLELITE